MYIIMPLFKMGMLAETLKYFSLKNMWNYEKLCGLMYFLKFLNYFMYVLNNLVYFQFVNKNAERTISS